MNKIYFVALICALVVGAYIYGVNITMANCRAEHAQNNLADIQNIQKNKKDIHEKVYKTGVADIRSVLRDKYTIAE